MRIQRIFADFKMDGVARSNTAMFRPQHMTFANEAEKQIYQQGRDKTAQWLREKRNIARENFLTNMSGVNPEIERGVSAQVGASKQVADATRAANKAVNLANPLAPSSQRVQLAQQGVGRSASRVQQAQAALANQSSVTNSVASNARKNLSLAARESQLITEQGVMERLQNARAAANKSGGFLNKLARRIR